MAKVGRALVIDPVPQLLGAERLLPDRGQFLDQLRARQAHQLTPPVRQRHRRRREQGRLRENAIAFGLGEGGGHQPLPEQALFIAA